MVDGNGERIWSYLGEHLRRTGQRGIRIPVPYALAYSLVRVAYATVFRRNPRLPHVLVPCRFEARLKPLRFTNERAEQMLGWKPPLAYGECVDRTYVCERAEEQVQAAAA